MVMGVTVDDVFCSVVEKGWLVQRVFGKREFLLGHAIANPNDDVIQGFKGGAFGDLDDKFERVNSIKPEGFILFAHKGELEKLIAEKSEAKRS